MCASVAGVVPDREGARVPGRGPLAECGAAHGLGVRRAADRLEQDHADAVRPGRHRLDDAADHRLVEGPQEVALPVVAKPERQAAAHRLDVRILHQGEAVVDDGGRRPGAAQDVRLGRCLARPAHPDTDEAPAGSSAARSRPSARARPGPRRRARRGGEGPASRRDGVLDVAGQDRPGSIARNSNDVTTPKLPPPPRSAQSRSGSPSGPATTFSPAAVMTSARTRLSQVNPGARTASRSRHPASDRPRRCRRTCRRRPPGGVSRRPVDVIPQRPGRPGRSGSPGRPTSRRSRRSTTRAPSAMA